MSFAAPWFLAGLAAAGLPVAIHLLNRRSARVVAFPATELLLATRRRTARRLQLRQLLLLIVRTALLALVPLMLARPYVAGAARAVRAGGPEVVGVVLDDSLSMRAAPDGATSWFDRARDAARGVVAGLGAEDAALLVLGAARAAGPAAPVDEPSFEHARVEDAIARAAPSALPGDLAAAVARAQALVAASPLPRKRVVVVTDGSAVGWPEAVRPEGGAGRAGGGASAPAASAERSLAVPGIALDVIDVSGGGPRDNVAVVDVVTEPAPSVGPRAYRIAATLANLGTAPLAGLEVDLRLEGATVATGFADLPAGGRVEKVFHHEMERPGLFAGEVALGGALDAAHDVLRDDDVRAFALVVHPAVRTLLVNGDPSTVTYRDELFYLEKALAPGKAARARIDPTVVTLDRVDDVALDRFDVVVLANVPALPAAVVSALVDFVARGGGVLLAAGARLSPAEWSLAMAELAPRGVRALKTVRAVGAEGSAPGGGRPVRMVRPAAGHPIFATFATGLSGAETWEYALAETDASDRSTVLLSFDDGAPALLERHIGAGSVLFLATTVDHDWSDLCIRPGFLPLMQATVLYLARSAPRAESGTVLVGSPRLVALPGGPLGAVSVSGPVGAPVRATPEELAAGARSWRFAATDASGVYRVRIEGKGGDELASDAFAVGVDPRESDLALLPAERLAALLRGAGSAGEGAGGPGGTSGAGTGGSAAAAGGARGVELGATPPNGTGLWGWLALAFLALLPVESWLARAIRARPRPPAPVAPAGRAAGRA